MLLEGEAPDENAKPNAGTIAALPIGDTLTEHHSEKHTSCNERCVMNALPKRADVDAYCGRADTDGTTSRCARAAETR